MTTDETTMFKFEENENQKAKILVIGIGAMGLALNAGIKRSLSGVNYHEIEHLVAVENLQKLHEEIKTAHLVFLLADLDEVQSRDMIKALGHTAQEKGVPAVGVFLNTLQSDAEAERFLAEISQFLKCSFITGFKAVAKDESDLSPDNQGSFNQFATRHIVSLISELILRDSLISVDYVDVTSVLDAGCFGRMGTGIATGQKKGKTAAELAVDRLIDQGVNFSEVKGLLTCVYGSSLFTMKEFKAASDVIGEKCPESSVFIMGLLVEEILGLSVAVSILTLS